MYNRIQNFNEFLNENKTGNPISDAILNDFENIVINIPGGVEKGSKEEYNLLMKGYQKAGFKRGLALTGGLFAFGFGFVIIHKSLKNLVKLLKKRIKINKILKNETDPDKRKQLRISLNKISKEEFDLKYKIVQAKKEYERSKVKNLSSTSIKNSKKLETRKSILDGLTNEYKELQARANLGLASLDKQIVNESDSATDIRDYFNSYLRGGLGGSKAIEYMVYSGVAITIFVNLIKNIRKKYKINTLLKGETDPEKRDQLMAGLKQLNKKEFDLTYKLKKAKNKYEKMSTKSTDDRQLTPKELAKIEKQRSKLNQLQQQYLEISNRIKHDRSLVNNI